MNTSETAPTADDADPTSVPSSDTTTSGGDDSSARSEGDDYCDQCSRYGCICGERPIFADVMGRFGQLQDMPRRNLPFPPDPSYIKTSEEWAQWANATKPNTYQQDKAGWLEYHGREDEAFERDDEVSDGPE